ncbi:MAG TPA: hypothetical protein VI198_01695, partial [Candidatus Eisenbacteria bacterium]
MGEMKPMIRFSILLLLGILAIPARASVPLVVPPPRAITALDSLRAEAQSARSAGDFARAEELLRRILSRFPGDGFALRDAVLLAQEQDDEQIALKVAPKGPGLVGGVKPAPADLLFQRGLVAFYGEQSSTAIAIFQEVTRLRPRWGWGLYYEARCRERLDQSRVEIDSVYREALRDSDVAGQVLYAALRRETDRLDGVRPREAAPLLKWIGAIPWLRGVAAEAAIADSLDFHPARLADFEALWRDARKRLGDTAGTLAEQLGYGACRTLSPPEAFRFIEARERDGLGVRDWRLARATYLDYYGLGRRAFATLESKGRGSTLWLRLALRRAIDTGTKDEALKLAARLDSASRDPEDVAVLQLAYQLYAEPKKAAALSESMARENPSLALYQRTHQSLPGDPRGLRALLESLDATGSNFETRIARLELREALGDTISMTELDPVPAGGIALRVGRLAEAALENGNFDRVKQL